MDLRNKMHKAHRFLIVFGVLSFLFITLLVACVVIMNTGDYNGSNKDFARLKSNETVETKVYGIGNVKKLHFFSMALEGKRTLFTDEEPMLRIVNSDRNAIEIKANKGVFDGLQVKSQDGIVDISFKDELYNTVEKSDEEYKGLYVDCEEFEVTVYAKISELFSDAEFDLDYQAPNEKLIWIIVSGEIGEGVIRDLNCQNFVLSTQGDSFVSVSGTVSNSANITVKHTSEVDASGLKANSRTGIIGNRLFGLSSIKWGEKKEIVLMEIGFILSVMLVVSIVACLSATAFFLLKYLKFSKKVNEQKNEENAKKNLNR